MREQIEARTEAARKQAEQIIEAARERADAASKAARDQAESLLEVARQQAEAILDAARKQAKTLSAPLTDMASSRTKSGETVVEAAETAVTQASAPQADAVAEADPKETPKPRRKSAKSAVDYDDWTKPQLQEELVKRGLPKSGNVPELRERLAEND